MAVIYPWHQLHCLYQVGKFLLEDTNQKIAIFHSVAATVTIEIYD